MDHILKMLTEAIADLDRAGTAGCRYFSIMWGRSSIKAADALWEDRVTEAESSIRGKGGQRSPVVHNLLMLDCTMKGMCWRLETVSSSRGGESESSEPPPHLLLLLYLISWIYMSLTNYKVKRSL